MNFKEGVPNFLSREYWTLLGARTVPPFPSSVQFSNSSLEGSRLSNLVTVPVSSASKLMCGGGTLQGQLEVITRSYGKAACRFVTRDITIKVLLPLRNSQIRPRSVCFRISFWVNEHFKYLTIFLIVFVQPLYWPFPCYVRGISPRNTTAIISRLRR